MKTIIAKSSVIVVGLWCALLAPVFAQSPGTNTVLTWSDCVGIAVKNNPDLASSRYALAASQSSYKGSYNGVMPQVSLSNSYNSNSGGGSGTGGSDSWQAQASVSMNLFNKSAIQSIKIAQAAQAQQEANLRQSSASLRFNLRKAFAQLLYAQQNIEVSRNIVAMRRDEAQLVNLRYDSGRESKGNMLRANAQLYQAQAELAQSERDLRTAQIALNRQLGRDDFSAITATGTLDTPAAPDTPTLQTEEALMGHRPDVLLQKAVVQGAEASLGQAQSPLWPSLTASYSYSGSGPSELPPLHSGWGLSLSYPLFGGGPTSAYYAVTTAKNNLERSKQDLRSVRDAAVLDLETSWSGFAGSIDQARVQASLLDAARQRNDEATIRYDSGLMTYDNWEIIVSDRVNQERLAVQSRLNATVAEATWAKALGKQIEE